MSGIFVVLFTSKGTPLLRWNITSSIVGTPIPNYFQKHLIPPTFVKAPEIHLEDSRIWALEYNREAGSSLQ
jgi:hypothetical protein